VSRCTGFRRSVGHISVS